MSTAEATEIHTLRDFLHKLGDIPPERVRFRPSPGTATVEDVAENKRCELIDGTLVEKAMGFRQSLVSAILIEFLAPFVRNHKLGLVLAPDATMEIMAGLVRLPDVAFISWDRLPDHRVPSEAVPAIVPDLAVEVLSPKNTTAEMARKRQEYFTAGVRLVWIVDLNRRVVSVYTSPSECDSLTEAGILTGGDVLPGFSLPVRELFSRLDERP